MYSAFATSVMCKESYLFDEKSTEIVVSVFTATALYFTAVSVVSLQPDLAALLTLQHDALTHHAVILHASGCCVQDLVALSGRCSVMVLPLKKVTEQFVDVNFDVV